MSILILNYLKETKNAIIGNPTAKNDLLLAGGIPKIVDCLSISSSAGESSENPANDIQTEAAHIIFSLANGSKDAMLQTFLATRVHEILIRCIANLRTNSTTALKLALIRALKALLSATADAIGPDLWGLNDVYIEANTDLQSAFDVMFELQNLDIYLPLLSDSSVQVSIAVAQIIASTVRNSTHRTSIIDWLPPSERPKEIKGKRGWENATNINASSAPKLNGWVIRQLINFLDNTDAKMQEAALSALAALTKEDSSLSKSFIGSGTAEWHSGPVFSNILKLTKSRNLDVQLAACLCFISILRSSPSNYFPHLIMSESSTMIYVLNNILTSNENSNLIRAKACFLLRALVVDNKELCLIAAKFGSLIGVMDLLVSITFIAPDTIIDWEDEEPYDTSLLREAVLTGLASLTLFDSGVRREVTSYPNVMRCIASCMKHPRVGVRYAACQCVRVLARDVANLRTSLLDSGLSLELLKIIKNRGEDKRIIAAALAGICNVVPVFSPIRQRLLEQDLLYEIQDLMTSEIHLIRLNAVWVLKNILHEATLNEKQLVLEKIGWDHIKELLHSHDTIITEQILNIMRNITVDEVDSEMLFDHADAESIIDELTIALKSHNDDVVVQGICVVKNIAASHSQRSHIFSNGNLLDALHNCMTNSQTKVRREAIECVKKLAQNTPYRHKELREAGIHLTLRRISSGIGNAGALGTSPPSAAHQMGMEEDSYARTAAKIALHYLESPEDVSF